MTTTGGDDWIGTEEAARMIGCTSRTVRRYLDAGQLAGRKLVAGQRPTYRVRRSAVVAFMRRYVLDTRKVSGR
jgi:excisionase family DNA binding protein